MAKVPDHGVRALAGIVEKMRETTGDHAAAKRIQGEVERLSRGAEALDNVRRKPSPIDTQEAHALKVGRMAKKLDAEVTAMINRAAEHYRNALQDLDRRIAEKVDLRPDAFAAEIRTAFRGLDQKAKLALMGQLVKENRGPELAAIVKAPSVLSGLSDEQRASYESSIIGMHAAAEVAERDQLESIMQTANSASMAAGNMAKRFSDPAQLAMIEASEAAAKAAGEAFDQSLQ